MQPEHYHRVPLGFAVSRTAITLRAVPDVDTSPELCSEDSANGFAIRTDPAALAAWLKLPLQDGRIGHTMGQDNDWPVEVRVTDRNGHWQTDWGHLDNNRWTPRKCRDQRRDGMEPYGSALVLQVRYTLKGRNLYKVSSRHRGSGGGMLNTGAEGGGESKRQWRLKWWPTRGRSD